MGHKRRSNVLDEDSASEQESDQGPAPNQMNKRPRSSLTNGSSQLLPSSYAANTFNDPAGTPSAKEIFQPGSLVRVALKNFVTYSQAEFLLGPSLNMIIGPNGTGKSTLVCAICLGLGWKTEHLGRAKDVADFIKHGAAEAEVEIELAKDPARHDSNPVITMHIKRSTGKSTFFLNGRAVPRKQIIRECQAFSIQIDNLCQFLPQDRVVEFAALPPVEMLAQTQRAAAPPEMSAMHDELKDLHEGQSKIKNDLASLTSNLKNLEDRQTLQRTDVERIQQRHQLQLQIRALELYKPSIQLKEARQQFDDAKARKLAAMQELERLEAEVEPTLRAVNEKAEYHEKIEVIVQQRSRLIKRSEENATTLLNNQTEISSRIKTANDEIESERNREKDLKRDRARTENKIRETKILMESEPPEVNAASYNEKIRECSREARELSDKAEEANNKQNDCHNQIKRRESQITQVNKEIASLHSKAGQQENKLRRASQDTFKAWKWVQENKNLFEGEVFGPPIVSCSVKDQSRASLVESALGNSDLLGITVTTKSDFNLLQSKLSGELRLVDVYPRSSAKDLSFYRPPVAREQLAELGLDAYLCDLMEGPEQVLAMLCDTRSLHRTAAAFRVLSPEQSDRITKSAIDSFVTPAESFTITRRREYGDQGTSTRTRKLKPPQYFTDQPVDTAAEQQLKAQLLELKGEIHELATQGKEHLEASKKYGVRHKELKKAQEDLQAEKDAKQNAKTAFDALPTRLNTLQGSLEDDNKKIQTCVKVREEKRREIDKDTLEKARASLFFANNVHALQRSHTDLLEAEILLCEALSELDNLRARNGEVDRLLNERKNELESLRTAQAEVKARATVLLRKVNEISTDLTDEEREVHEQQPDDLTAEALENEVEALKARLEMVHEGDPNVMRDFAERGQKIEKAQEKLTRLTRELEQSTQKIESIRSDWEPRLDELISQISDAFSHNFERIGCAGQVEIEKTEDFADWAIKIKVKFRENESLSVLDNHRQSGGERAVSTIFYLMALQSLARAPFRVVDEINQGMDPKNERLVHSRMVAIACAEHTSQYFLITPKLLPNLEYHPKMKIHCIASGEYMPDDHKQLDFQALAKRALQVQGRLSAAA